MYNIVNRESMYSQNNEEQIILKYFGVEKGTVLDIGANDGKTLSNSYACILRGWQGVMVEPSSKCFESLFQLHQGNCSVFSFNFAIAEKTGTLDFYESGEHLKNGDHGLLSTLKESELERWKGSDNKFTKTKARAVTFKRFLELSRVKKFDLISIDAEGVDYEILKQMDLEKLGCKMLIVETNGVENEKYIDYCAKFGMTIYHRNQENLIFVK